MRQTSQSMYQSSYKQPASKVIDGSSLLKSSINPGMSQIGGRKVEGQDMRRSNKITKPNFQQTVNNLKNKPNQKILEDEYIGGLQQEIKYLEYELKLLKDKQLIQREGVNELDNFLKDEIPINENILAMKNKYNSTKTNLQVKYRELIKKKQEAEGVLSMQQKQIENYHRCIDGHRKQMNDRKAEFKDKLSQLMKELSLTRDEYEASSQNSKKKQEQIKRMNQEIAALQRKQEKEKVQEVRMQEEKDKGNEKFEEKFKITKDELIETEQLMEELEGYGETNPLLQALEQENSTLRKRIMLNEKQKSTAENIIAEIELFLKEEERQREAERQQKGKLINVADGYRTQLQHLERYVDTLIKDQTLRTKSKMLKQMSVNLTEKSENYQLLTDRLRNLQQQCSNLIQQKKELNDALETEKSISKELDNRISEIESNTVTSRSQTEALQRITHEIVAQIAPTDGELQKCKGRIPLVEKEIEKRKITIHHLNKQIDLLTELKTLDMQQLQMISNGGSNVQNVLHSFIRNWEKIKSL